MKNKYLFVIKEQKKYLPNKKNTHINKDNLGWKYFSIIAPLIFYYLLRGTIKQKHN